ncbi:PhzF family phenazine biosynthesis protein [Sphingomonas sp. ID0503]|uniref:PhzF family phenazine biosynthesis protein n=1 Tax=Sphingomonas sp. ID0503 TaxID=3399691 RepID=UPI003AFA3BEA
MARAFQMVDVFGQAAFSGNPLAVVADGTGLSTEEMLAITRWLNLSETTFLLPPTDPGADYRVRIFTLSHELPFAGHPTLGTCHAWLEAGGVPRDGGFVVQECGAGLVRVKRGERLAFAGPPLVRSGAVSEAELADIAAVLNLPVGEIVDAQWVDNGPGWVAVMLASAEAVLAVRPERAPGRRFDIGIVGPHPAGGDARWEIRALFSDQNGTLIEDPVCGSLNASVADWLYTSGRVSGAYVAAQGAAIGRDGRIHVERDEDGTVWVAGATRTMVRGTIDF